MILYEDQKVIVCHKPAGLAVESAGVGQMDLVSKLKNYLHGSYLGVVHRLDQPVEGLLVFAKNPAAAAELSTQLQKEILNKRYLAAVYGTPEKSAATLVDYLCKDNRLRVSKTVPEETPGAKKAVLSYETAETVTLDDNSVITLLRVTIETGRFHQIRAQLAHMGCPILGDQKYGNPKALALSRDLGIRYPALCADSLSFSVSGKKREFQIKPENKAFSYFREMIE